MGQDPDAPVIDFKFQNIPFVLNILDSLAGDDRFVDLRKRTRSHRILTKIEEATEKSAHGIARRAVEVLREARQQIDAAQEEFNKKIVGLGKPQGSRSPREGADEGTGTNPTGAESRRDESRRSKKSGTGRSSRASGSWPPRFAACRIDTSYWPCCCRRSRRSCWPSSCSSTVVRPSKRASILDGCVTAARMNRRPLERLIRNRFINYNSPRRTRSAQRRTKMNDER